MTYSNNVLRYYGTLSPTDPMHAGSDDIFVRTSPDLGASWSSPMAITNGRNIQRPAGVTVGNTDYVYLPSISAGSMYVGRVAWDQSSQSTFPYVNNFDSAGLSTATTGVTLDTGKGVLNYQAGGGTFVGTAAESITGIGTSDFVLSTRFVLNNAAGSGNLVTIGLGAFGSSSNFLSTGGDSFYLADWGVSSHASEGQLRILAQGDSSHFTSATGDTDGVGANGSSVVIGNTYELRLTGAYAGSTLNLTLSLFDALGNQIGTSAMASDGTPLEGQYFGYRNRTAGLNHAIDISYDRFSLTPPPLLVGDYNSDGVVDAADYVVWRKHLGTTFQLPNEGTNASPGEVTTADYDVWRAHFRQRSEQQFSRRRHECPRAGSVVFCIMPRCSRSSFMLSQSTETSVTNQSTYQ